ncbi:MAG: hypothetical protein WCF90_07080 [Methanomicrobiales archaeon]
MCSIIFHIRDIPDSLIGTVNNTNPPRSSYTSGEKGSCSAKHYLLAEIFRLLGVPVVYATFPFLWYDPDLDDPPGLRKLAATLHVAHHLACPF